MTQLVLASTSRFRARILDAAGVSFIAESPACDENAIKTEMRAKKPNPSRQALHLAEAKALSLSARRPEALTIGCDQILSCGERIFDKPCSVADARAQLLFLRGKTHFLHTAIVLAKGEDVLWRHVERAALTMRPFSDAFLEDYLARAGDAVLHTVGGYEIEGAGIQLFSAVEGDAFAIQGLPLIPLLEQLRERGAIQA